MNSASLIQSDEESLRCMHKRSQSKNPAQKRRRSASKLALAEGMTICIMHLFCLLCANRLASSILLASNCQTDLLAEQHID